MIGGLLLTIITSPVMIITALAILIETGRPIIFKNERVGKEGRTFNTFKFRSMRQQYCIGPQFKQQEKALSFEQELIKEKNTKAGPVYKIKNDPRVTRVGHFIRKTSIDESFVTGESMPVDKKVGDAVVNRKFNALWIN